MSEFKLELRKDSPYYIIEKLNKENARLREALKVYADKNMWYRSAHSIFDDHFCAAVCNAWEIAKKALEESK